MEFQERGKVLDTAEIAGLPERDVGRIQGTVVKMARVAGLKMDKNNILKGIRVQKWKKIEEAQRAYPLEIQIKFSDREIRDKFMTENKRKKIIQLDLDFGCQLNIYAREQLTFFRK